MRYRHYRMAESGQKFSNEGHARTRALRFERSVHASLIKQGLIIFGLMSKLSLNYRRYESAEQPL